MIQVLLVLIVIGVCLYLVNTYIPMAAPIKTIKTIITVVVVIFLCLWLLQVFGVADIPVPTMRR